MLFCDIDFPIGGLEPRIYSSVCSEQIISTSNQFSILSDASIASPSPNDYMRPIHASTPDRQRYSKSKSVPLKLLNVNCQSIKSKQCRIKNLVESTDPDIVVCTETWVDPTIIDSQIFPSQYNLFRKDRAVTGGGVLIAVKKDHLSSPVPELQSDCEIVWTKISLVGRRISNY